MLREYIAYINTAETLEAMTITFAEDGDNVNILVGWENSMAALPVTFK